ncbi:hypothetical protein [Laceyella putida]|uniref:Uncharacterized protein n=1 Tax=Laceyella putida TaxID=110101 RepID=A0ABW2RLR4_9BACL
MLGRIYLGSILVGGITGFGVVIYTESFIRQMGFAVLDILWLISGRKAYSTIRQGRLVTGSG